MAEKDYKKLVENKSKLPENATCVDCGTKSPKWTSVRYGTFFCLECAAIHRSLGVYLDFVKSVGLDSWDRESYLPIEYGGNARFKEYLSEHGLDSLETVSKYKHSLAIEYTQNLMKRIQEATGIELKPSERKEVSKPTRTRPVQDTFVSSKSGVVSDSDDSKKKSDGIYSGSKFTSSLTSLKNIIGDSVKTISEKTVEYGSKLGSSFKSHAKNLYEKSSETVSGMRKDRPKPEESAKDSGIAPKKPQRNTTKHDWS